MLGVKETAFIISTRHLSVFLEQAKVHVMSQASLTSLREKESTTSRGEGFQGKRHNMQGPIR